MRLARVSVVATVFTAALLLAMDPHLTPLARLFRDATPSTLVVPVAGVDRRALRASFGVPRPGNRTHQGIDILAASGTSVIAAADGIVASTMPNRLGGNVVWVLGAGRRIYYYAHLDSLEEHIRAGAIVAAGDRLGKVGTTGNAAGGPPHLHFGIYLLAPRAAIDPFPLLRREPIDSVLARSERL